MSGEELLALARKHMWAAWQLSAEELASQAASTLLGLGMLVPEGGAQELEKLAERVAELEAAPTTVYRASHDSIVMGLYTTREAAQAHCEAQVTQEEPAGSILHLSWSADDIGPDAEYELHITPAETGGLIRGTGYVVTPLEVAAEFDPDGDE